MGQDDKLDLVTLLGLELTLEQYQEQYLDGHPAYFETTPLQFECTACGQCCTRPGLVFLTPADIEAIAAHFEMSEEEVKVSLLERDGPDWVLYVDEEEDCPFLYDNRCRIHEVKPLQCRTYPFWPELVGHRRAWRAERRHCPGIGQGRTYSADEVRALLTGRKATWEPPSG